MAQKSLLSIITQVAAEFNFPAPTTVVSSQDQNIQKLLNLGRAVCDDLLAERDWQLLQKRYTFTTVNGQETYPFPSDYERWISGTFFDANNRWAMSGPKTPIEWEALKTNQMASPYTQYRVFGDTIALYPVPGASAYTFNMEYVSNYYVRSASGTLKPDFTVDDDICLFDHRVVVYGIKLKMRESTGSDTTAALSDYRRALEQAKGSDTPARKLNLLGGNDWRFISNANIPEGNWS